MDSISHDHPDKPHESEIERLNYPTCFTNHRRHQQRIMKATIEMHDTDKVECTVRIRMTMRDWKVIREALEANPYHGIKNRFSTVIARAVRKLEIQVEEREESDGSSIYKE